MRLKIVRPWFLFLILFAGPAYADDGGARERTFVRALEQFDTAKTPDDYRACARLLEGIIADGFESGAVYYNLGNAYFRAGDYGRAIVNYRKAKPLRPRDSYLEANLQQALATAPGRLAAPPVPWWSHVLFWTDWFSFPRKAQFTAFGFMLAAALSVIAVLLRRSRLHVVAGALVLLCLALGIDVVLTNPSTTMRAAITGETIARKGTGKDYEPAFDQPLRDGAEFTVLSETADWTFGHFEGVGDGWVRNEFVAR
jgi:tetratricopeptide (TPR) repeat protein